MRVFVALLIVLSGCLGGADTNPKDDPRPDPGDSDDGGGGTPPVGGDIVLLTDFGFADCSGVEVHYLVETAAAQTLLPDNYTVADGQGPPNHPAQGLARWRFLSCPSFSSPSTDLNETVYGDVSLAIEHPGFGEQGEGNWYRFQIFSRDDNLAAAWRVAGYDVITDDVAISSGALPGQQVYDFAGYTIEALPLSNDGVLEEEVLFTETDAAPLIWGEVVDETTSVQLAVGTFSAPSGDPLSSLIAEDPSRQSILVHGQTQVVEAELVLARL